MVSCINHHHLWLYTEAYLLDLDWWLILLPTWNGVSCILETDWSTSPPKALFTNASGILVWVVYWSGNWIQAWWSPSQKDRSIFAIASAIITWGHQYMWPWKKVLVNLIFDNQAVVDIWLFIIMICSVCSLSIFNCTQCTYSYSVLHYVLIILYFALFLNCPWFTLLWSWGKLGIASYVLAT